MDSEAVEGFTSPGHSAARFPWCCLPSSGGGSGSGRKPSAWPSKNAKTTDVSPEAQLARLEAYTEYILRALPEEWREKFADAPALSKSCVEAVNLHNEWRKRKEELKGAQAARKAVTTSEATALLGGSAGGRAVNSDDKNPNSPLLGSGGFSSGYSEADLQLRSSAKMAKSSFRRLLQANYDMVNGFSGSLVRQDAKRVRQLAAALRTHDAFKFGSGFEEAGVLKERNFFNEAPQAPVKQQEQQSPSKKRPQRREDAVSGPASSSRPVNASAPRRPVEIYGPPASYGAVGSIDTFASDSYGSPVTAYFHDHGGTFDDYDDSDSGSSSFDTEEMNTEGDDYSSAPEDNTSLLRQRRLAGEYALEGTHSARLPTIQDLRGDDEQQRGRHRSRPHVNPSRQLSDAGKYKRDAELLHRQFVQLNANLTQVYNYITLHHSLFMEILREWHEGRHGAASTRALFGVAASEDSLWVNRMHLAGGVSAADPGLSPYLQRDVEDGMLSLVVPRTHAANLSRQSFVRDLEHVKKLISDVEDMFTVFSGKSSRDSAREELARPLKQVSQKSLFGVGFWIGTLVPLLALFIAVAFVWKPPEGHKFKAQEFFAAIPIFRAISQLILMLWTWGLMVYVYKLKRINYVFIMQFDPRSSLTYWQIWKGAAFLTFFWLLTFFLYVAHMRSGIKLWEVSPQVYPVVLLAVFLFAALNPFHIFHRRSRGWLYKNLVECWVSPFADVFFAHFFISDIMTSMPHLFSDIEYTVCYYASASFLNPNSATCDSWVTYLLPYTQAAPLWWRFWQCSRRLYFTGDFEHFANAMKYFLSLSAHVIASVHLQFPSESPDFSVGRILWVIFFIIATSYLYYWDMAMDWGCLRRGAASFALRKRIIFHPSKYYLAMFLDGIARFHWLWGLTTYQVPMAPQLRTWIFDFVEILRRSMWGVFRMENEHLNNCGHFRATTTIPLPMEQDAFDRESRPLVQLLSDNFSRLSASPLGRSFSSTKKGMKK